eukprot:PhF_6_TR25616/c0_g1_i2/m.35968
MIQQIKKRQRRKKQMVAQLAQLQPQHLSLPASSSSSSKPKRVIKSPLLSSSPHQSMMSGTAGMLDMSQMSFGALGGGGTVPNSPRQSGRKTFTHAHTQTIAAGCFKGTARVSNGLTKTELQRLSAAVQDIRMSIVKTERSLK